MLASAGMAAMTAHAPSAGGEIFDSAATRRIQALAMTAVIKNTWLHRSRRWFRFRTILAMLMRRHWCALEVNTFNALRHSGALPGDLVAVQGIGGLGHFGIQFANKFGYRVAAIGRGAQIESLALKLGADLYIDSKVKNAAEELHKLGGARVILATAPDSRAMTELIGGLGANGKLILIGVASGSIEFAPLQLIKGGKTIEGWAGVTPADSDDALRFAALRGVRAMIETYPLEQAAEAYARMMSGNAEFRVVLTM